MKIIFRNITYFIFSFGIILNAQNNMHTIKGQIIVRPEFNNMRVDVEIKVYIDNIQRGSSFIVRQHPYRFNEGVNKINEDEKVKLKVDIFSPEGYQLIDKFVKYNGQHVRIILRRVSDIFIIEINKAQILGSENNNEEAIKILENLKENNLINTYSQKYELYRELAKLYRKTEKPIKKILVLEELYNSGKFKSINENRKKIYWQERLDAFLELADYNKLNQPERDFGFFIKTLSSNNINDKWQKFMLDISGKYSLQNIIITTKLISAKNITNQLQQVKNVIR
ncbi:MAG: hypothetical protein IIC75_03670 [Bacteroidetes bacterium]|nr:hypothetical protein [Bacteroidota bacterium]